MRIFKFNYARKLALLMLCLCSANALWAKVKLPQVFSSNMVLQRNRPILLWGWADPQEKITVSFMNSRYTAVAGKNGQWQLTMKAAPAGGPYELKVNDQTLNNILMGDVWLFSGQSNMEFHLENAEGADEAIKNSANPNIRLFTVGQDIDFKPLDEITKPTAWQLCEPSTVKTFSAVAYFMAVKMQKELGIPIGLVHSSFGGTMIEGFIGKEMLDTVSRLKTIYREVSGLSKQAFMDKKAAEIKARYGNFDTYTDSKILWDTIAPVIPGPEQKWHTMKLPTLWEKAGLPNTDGVIWFAKEVNLTQEQANGAGFLSLGRIADQTVVFVNGRKIASSIDSRDLVRAYPLAAGILEPGVNQVLVRVANKGRNGGIWGPASKLYLKTSDDKQTDLTGDWKFYLQNIKISLHPNDIPSSIYNAMIYPLRKVQFKGCVWYQGESSANWADEYTRLLKSLINEWRTVLKQPTLPFIVVQLPNYKKVSDEPETSPTWALLREAQQNALILPNTGLVVTIDKGMADNIHPIYKEPVGNRMALKALQLVYHKNVIADGPVYKSMTLNGNQVTLTFDHAAGLTANNQSTRSNFQIAGADKKFVWADAKIENGKVIIWSNNVKKPVAVRYAWSDNPGENYLSNGAGLPARPFRTDKWAVPLEAIPR